MTQYLVFENPVGAPGAGLQKQVIINADHIKYIEPVDTLSFKLQLNNGGNIEIGAAVAKSSEVIEKVRDLITSSARISSGKVLTVKPDFIGQWTIDAMRYNAPSSGGVTGSGASGDVTFWDGATSITGDATTPFYYTTGTQSGITGRLGLGTSSPNFKMDISGGDLRFENNDGIRFGGTGSNLQYFRISTTGTSSGTFEIGSVQDPYFTILRSGTAGQIRFDNYGSGTYTGTATYGLSVDASGNIIETASGGGGVAWPTEYDAALGNLLQGSNPGTTQLGTTAYGIGAGANLTTQAGGSPKDAGNTAFGYNALGSENGEGYNTAIGYRALGNQNVSSMFSVPGNTALGFEAGKECTTGLANVFVGNEIQSVNSGQSIGNVAVGSRAMRDLGTGFANVAIGERALFGVNSNTGNIAIGYTANDGNTTGNQNIVIGYNAQPSSLTVSNEITLGNSSTAVLRCQQTSITALSDERDKTSIEDLPYGLDFINKLQPRKFVWDNRSELREEVNDDGSRSKVEFYPANKGKKDFGFIAQEVQAHDDDVLKLVYDENPDRLEMSYGKLVPILVKAIQELKNELDKKQDK